jgi:hypothetical protein
MIMDGMIQQYNEEGGMSRRGGNGGYIQYRHSLQLTVGGHSHTLEVEIPIPVGADDETRVELLREAEVGMRQLADQVRRGFSQSVQREQTAQASGSMPTSIPKPATRPASIPAPQTPTQPLPSSASRVSETGSERSAPAKREVVVPPTRPSVGASMPAAPLSSNVGGTLAIGDFVKIVKEELGLTSSQAMALLGVKSLSGLNLRDELRRLQILVAQGATPGGNNARTGRTEEQTARPAPASVPSPAPAAAPVRSTVSNPVDERRESFEPEDRLPVREERPVYVFDEEVGPDDDEEPQDELDDLEDLTEEDEEEDELSPVMQGIAEDRLKKLRELRGATTVSPSRIQVLNNVVISQIGDERLRTLIEGVWGVTVPKKLKVDQVEELISWAKSEDDFVNQVDAVLALVEEERYARGNR